MENELPLYARELQEAIKQKNLSIKESARSTGISYTTFNNIYHGRRKDLENIKPEIRKKIYEMFNLECFKVSEESQYPNKLNKDASAPIVRGNSISSLEDHVNNAEHAFYVLCHALEMLRPYSDLRKELAKRLYQPYVGRLTGYLEGIYTDNENIIPIIPKLPSKRDE